MSKNSGTDVIVVSNGSGESVRDALANSDLKISGVSAHGDVVTATNGSQFLYRLLGTSTSLGRRSIPAEITVAPITGEPGKRRVSVRTNDRGFVLKFPSHYAAARELAESVAQVVRRVK